MIHRIWILSVSYHISIYFLFFKHYFHYNIYVNILISLHRTDGSSHCIYFKYLQYTCSSNDRYTVTIHGCCLFLSHIFPTIRANIASLWSTNTKVSEIHWWFYYCYFFILSYTSGPSRCWFFTYFAYILRCNHQNLHYTTGTSHYILFQ